MLTTYFAFLKSAKKRSSLILVLALCFGLSAESDEAPAPTPFPIHVVQKNANGNTYRIGDRIALYIEIPQSIQNQNPNLEIKPEDNIKSLAKAGWYLDKQVNFISGNLRFVVSPIKLGDLILPQLVITNQNKEEIGKTDVWQVKVITDVSAEDAQKPSEFLPLENITLSGKMWAIIIVLTAAACFLVAFIIRKIQKSRKKPVAPASVPEPPKEQDHILANRALEELYKKYPYSADHLKPVAFGVSEILKNYFSNRLGVDARESTTQEMIALLNAAGVVSADVQLVRSLFVDLDLIKFTKKENYKDYNETSYKEFKSKAAVIVEKLQGVVK